MAGEFTVLGIGADPRMYGYRPVSSQDAEAGADEYISQHPGQRGLVSALLTNDDFIGFIIELCLALFLNL